MSGLTPKRRELEQPPDDDMALQVAHPFAYAADRTFNDLTGENGMLGDWGYEKRVAAPDDFIPRLSGELLRTFIESGGYGFSQNLLKVIGGNMMAGFMRDPEEVRKEWGIPPETSNARVRLYDAATQGALAGALGGLLPMMARIPRMMYTKAKHPKEFETIQDYVGDYEAAGTAHKANTIGPAAEKILPRYSGKVYRGQPLDDFGKSLERSDLKPGDTFAPGRAMSTSRSEAVARGFRHTYHNSPGPMMTIRLKDGRDARYANTVNFEQEILSRPDAKFKVLSVERDKKTGAIIHLELEELGDDISRIAKIRQEALEYGSPLSGTVLPQAIGEDARPAREKRFRVRRGAKGMFP